MGITLDALNRAMQVLVTHTAKVCNVTSQKEIDYIRLLMDTYGAMYSQREVFRALEKLKEDNARYDAAKMAGGCYCGCSD